MKKIILSVSIIAVIAAIGVGVTIALFNDTETSAGNIFVAGTMDLKVDHTLATYNGVDCETCSVEVYSSIATKIVAASVGASVQGPFPVQAVDVSNPHPAWQNEAALAPAQWIWATNPTTQNDTTNNAEYTFENKFQWNGTAISVNLDLALAADNGYKIILNGTTIVDKISTQFNYGSAVPLNGGEETAFKNAMLNGENTLDIVVRNMSYPGGPSGNPAGLLFKLNIQRESAECEADSAFQRTCRLWTLKDLGLGDTFWNFDDVKPGDHGTNVISLHPDNNDAWACLNIINKQDDENDLVDPEAEAGDLTFGPTGNGELSGYLSTFIWWDTNHNGVFDSGEVGIDRGDFESVDGLPLADSLHPSQLTGDQTVYLGWAWCAGEWANDPWSGSFACDGSEMYDDAQTDSFKADIEFYLEQWRNNPNFRCSNY